MMTSSLIWISLKALKFFQGRILRFLRRRLVQALSIKRMINARQFFTRIWQGSSCCWRCDRFVTISTSGSSLWFSLQTSNTFLINYVYIHLLLSTFILIIVCNLLNLSRRLHWMLRQERHLIFGTTRNPSIITWHIFGKILKL